MTIPTGHLLYPTPERVAEATNLLRREAVTGEYLHPAVRANCEQVLRNSDDIFGHQITTSIGLNGAMPLTSAPAVVDDGSGVLTMTESEFKEEIRQAKYDAYEEGWHGGAGWPQSEGNPYKVSP